jgi:hypothetical protein
VTQADGIAKDEAAREMVAKLREALQARVESERASWAKDIEASLADDKLVRAVRLSGRIPDPGAKLAPEITAKLVAATNAALSADNSNDRWAALIEAAAEAPFRRDVVPVSLPAAPTESLLATAAQASNRIPALLKLLGLTIPPPPKAKAGARPLPPPPPRAVSAAAVAPAVEGGPAVAASTPTPTAPEVAPAVEVTPTEALTAPAEVVATPAEVVATPVEGVAAPATAVVEEAPVAGDASA